MGALARKGYVADWALAAARHKYMWDVQQSP